MIKETQRSIASSIILKRILSAPYYRASEQGPLLQKLATYSHRRNVAKLQIEFEVDEISDQVTIIDLANNIYKTH